MVQTFLWTTFMLLAGNYMLKEGTWLPIHLLANTTHPFNGPLSGTTQVSRYQKGKTSSQYFTNYPSWCPIQISLMSVVCERSHKMVENAWRLAYSFSLRGSLTTLVVHAKQWIWCVWHSIILLTFYPQEQPSVPLCLVMNSVHSSFSWPHWHSYLSDQDDHWLISVTD